MLPSKCQNQSKKELEYIFIGKKAKNSQTITIPDTPFRPAAKGQNDKVQRQNSNHALATPSTMENEEILVTETPKKALKCRKRLDF